MKKIHEGTFGIWTCLYSHNKLKQFTSYQGNNYIYRSEIVSKSVLSQMKLNARALQNTVKPKENRKLSGLIHREENT